MSVTDVTSDGRRANSATDHELPANARWDLHDLVDTERYPLHDLEGKGAHMLADASRTLAETALCCLEGFVRPTALNAMLDEVNASEGEPYWVDNRRTVYSWRDLSMLPETHPARTRSKHRLGTITKNEFSADGALVSFFECRPITYFLRLCLGLPSLFPVACPHLGLNIKVMNEGSHHGWHFDVNDGAVSLMLQRAAEGGVYEYAPYLRSETDENYDQVAAIVRGESTEGLRRVQFDPGSLCLFNGRRSLHRVTEVVRGSPDRWTAVLSYDATPGLQYKDSTKEAVLGRLPRASG